MACFPKTIQDQWFPLPLSGGTRIKSSVLSKAPPFKKIIVSTLERYYLLWARSLCKYPVKQHQKRETKLPKADAEEWEQGSVKSSALVPKTPQHHCKYYHYL